MMEKQNNIPKLRFPEFSDGWDSKRLGEITTWASGGTPSKEIPYYWNGQIPWISASSMRGIQYFDSPTKITEEGLKSGSKLAKQGSLLILVRGSMLFNTIPIWLTMRYLSSNQDVKSISVHEVTTSIFILYWFISNESIILNMVTGIGIGAGKLDLPDLKSLNISLPTLSEQQK
jgi:type I restriction enzyme S subunit